SERSRKLWNQVYLALTFSKPPQPGRKKRSRPSEMQITVPRHDKRCLKEVQKPAHIWIRHSLRKKILRPSVYLTIRREVPFRHPYAPKIHSKETETKNSNDNKRTTLKKDSKKNANPHETTPESKKTLNENIKREYKTSKTPSKSHESELFKNPKHKSETISVSKVLKTVSMKDTRKVNDSRKSKETDTESLDTRDTKSSKNNSNNKSETCSKNCSSMDLIIYLEESGARSMDFNAWLNNYSQNNSKKPAKKEPKKDAKKSSDAESVDSKDAKKDKKITKKDSKKKDTRKDTESTDAESVDSKDARKDSKNTKKDSKKGDKKKKDARSTDTESIDSKGTKKDSKAKKGDKKKDAKKDIMSTDADSESEWGFKKDMKNEKNDKKDDRKKYALMDQYSTETESDLEFKIDRNSKIKKKLRKDAKNYYAQSTESTDGSSEHSKKDPNKSEMIKSVDSDTEESVYILKKIAIDESDASSTDSKKEALESKRKYRLSRKTTFREKEKEKERKRTGRIPPSRERPPLPPCEPFLSSPKVKRLCWCKMPPPPPKPRYAP
ncbi:Cylicin-1, partial [Galemys pyrenaicus]